MARRTIPEDKKHDFKKRFEKIKKKIPASYTVIVNFKFPGKYNNVQIRHFVNGKTFDFEMLEDFEIIFAK